MKRHIITIITILLISAGASIVPAQNSEIEESIKEAVHNIDSAYIRNDINLLLETNALLDRILSIDSTVSTANYYKAYIGYRLYMQSQAGTKLDVEKFYDPSVKICKNLIIKKELLSDAKGLLAGLYLMRLANNQLEAMSLFPKINDLLNEATMDDPNNPRPYVVLGMITLNTPPAFGGSPEKSIEIFSKAIELYKTQKEESLIRWGLAESYAWLGQAYQRTGANDKAKEAYETILKTEPDFAWVKYALLPSLTKENKN